MDKYLMSKAWLEKLVPNLRLCDLNRITYQQLLNDYAVHHERQTTMDFHHQLKGAIQDAVDDGLITKDPTRKAIIKGKTPSPKKIKAVITSEQYNRGCFFTRNRYMVDKADVVVCAFNGKSGGTAYTVDYALKQNKIVIQIDPETSEVTMLSKKTFESV